MDELCSLELTEVSNFLSNIDDDISRPILRKARFLLEQLIEIGVGYLSLARAVSTCRVANRKRLKWPNSSTATWWTCLYAG
ncbi:MAG: hypothetical protein IPH45_16010 [Bacteroidales bacterium]|nr:hypothetical protein [Bacteroidales bacterium]